MIDPQVSRRLVLLLVGCLAWGCAVTDRFGAGARKKDLLAKAAKAMARDDAAEAATLLAEARTIDPKDPEVLGRLGIALVASGHEDQAFLPLKEAVEAKPTSETRYAYGRLLRRRRSYGEARPMLEKALEGAKEPGPILVELGVTLILTDQTKEAEQRLSAAVQEVPDSYLARFHLGEIYRQKQDYAKARPQFESALKASPDDSYAQFALAETLFALNEIGPAGDLYRAVLTKNKPFPRLGRICYQLAQIAYRKRDYRRALGFLELAASKSYEPDLVALSRARCAMGLRDYQAARKLLEPFLAKPDGFPQAVFLMGRVELSTGNPEQALPLLEKALKLPLSLEDVHAAMGTAHLELADRAPDPAVHAGKALASFTKAIQRKPKHREALMGLARIYAVHQIDLQLAASHLQTVLEAWPGDAEATGLMAQVLARQGKVGEALETLNPALEARPKEALLHFLRGALLLATARPKEAEEAVVSGIKLDGGDLYGRLLLTAVYSRTGRVKVATECLRELVKPGAGSHVVPGAALAYGAIARVLDPTRSEPRVEAKPDVLRQKLAAAQAQIARLRGTAGTPAAPTGALQALEILRGLVEEFALLDVGGRFAAADREPVRQMLTQLLAEG